MVDIVDNMAMVDSKDTFITLEKWTKMGLNCSQLHISGPDWP